MNTKTCLLIFVALAFAGCESTKRFTDRHPVVTGIGVALVIGSVAASVSGNGHNSPSGPVGPANPPCTPQPNGTCR